MKLAIITARGGSKRIPRKNEKPFAGRPMLAYAIATAQASGLFDRIIVSSDDAEIMQLAVRLGAEAPFTRPPEISDDHTPLIPVVQHAIRAIEEAGDRPERVCCILPTVPFLQPADLQQAAAQLEAGDTNYVFPVTTFPCPPQRALTRNADGQMTPMFPEFRWSRSQDLPEGFQDTGQFYYGKRDAWLSGKGAHDGGSGMPIPRWRVQDIDTPEDWTRAELMYQLLVQGGWVSDKHLPPPHA